MAFFSNTISLADIPQDDERGPMEPIPEGVYDVVVQGIDLRTTKAGTGQYMATRLDVTGPTHQGRVLWTNINFDNPNPAATAIGLRQLGELMKAVGVDPVDDTDQLLGGRLKATVIIKDDVQYGRRNEVKKLKSAAPDRSSAPLLDKAAPAKPAPAAKSSSPPWAR